MVTEDSFMSAMGDKIAVDEGETSPAAETSPESVITCTVSTSCKVAGEDGL